GTPIVIFTDGPVITNPCSASQTRTFTASDGCGNSTTAARTVTWTNDQTPPSITAPGTTTLGCNPAASDINAALGSATATDACGTPTVNQSDGPITSTGCSRSQTRTFTAIDACGNTATTLRTITWIADIAPPVFTGSYSNTGLGCNPAASDIANALGSATATDGCSSPTITFTDGAITTSSCSASQ